VENFDITAVGYDRFARVLLESILAPAFQCTDLHINIAQATFQFGPKVKRISDRVG
jgi:hypothetical protein